MVSAEPSVAKTTLDPPPRFLVGTARPRRKRLWLTVAFVWCLVMFTAMVLWQSTGDTADLGPLSVSEGPLSAPKGPTNATPHECLDRGVESAFMASNGTSPLQ